MKKKILFLTLAVFLPLGLQAADKKLGFVNFKSCIEISKHGKAERDTFESLKQKLGEGLEKTDKELADLSQKIQDQEYMDSLSDNAQNELKQKFDTLNQEIARYQNQYYQILQQANYRVMQTLHKSVCDAAEKIRKDKKLDLLLNEESTFAYSEDLDCTNEVIKIMDTTFDIEAKETK